MTKVTKPKPAKAQQPKQPLAKKAVRKPATKKAPSAAKSSGAPDDGFNVLLESKASKLSPKSEGHISYQLGKDNNGAICVKLTGNTIGSGIFSKNPIPLQSIIEILEKQGDRSFKSSSVKGVFTGKGSGSSNNISFLIAALRSEKIGLITASDKSQFLSVVVKDFKTKAKALLAIK